MKNNMSIEWALVLLTAFLVTLLMSPKQDPPRRKSYDEEDSFYKNDRALIWAEAQITRKESMSKPNRPMNEEEEQAYNKMRNRAIQFGLGEEVEKEFWRNVRAGYSVSEAAHHALMAWDI